MGVGSQKCSETAGKCWECSKMRVGAREHVQGFVNMSEHVVLLKNVR